VESSEASVGGQGTVEKKPLAKVEGRGEIIRADGTRIPFFLTGETELSEADLRQHLKVED
jgi:hypothetical protein